MDFTVAADERPPARRRRAAGRVASHLAARHVGGGRARGATRQGPCGARLSGRWRWPTARGVAPWPTAHTGPRAERASRKFFWSNFGPYAAVTTMLEYAHRRHSIEQYYDEAKGELAWDQFQGRGYDAFHRHAVTVMLSYSFLVWLERRARQQVRRRGPARRRSSPRRDQFQRAIPQVHRAVADWLLQAALRTPLRRLPPFRTYSLRL